LISVTSGRFPGGTTSAASFASLRPGSSARADLPGVAALLSNQQVSSTTRSGDRYDEKNQVNEREQIEILTIEQTQSKNKQKMISRIFGRTTWTLQKT